MQGANSLTLDRNWVVAADKENKPKLIVYKNGDTIRFHWTHNNSASFDISKEEMVSLTLFFQSLKGVFADEKIDNK